MGFAIEISSNTTVTPLSANGEALANVAAGTIHLANVNLKLTTSTLDGNTKVTPLYANGAALANVEAGTIHLANAVGSITLTMPTKVARRVDDFDDVNAGSVSNGQVIRYISANDTFISSDRSDLNGGSF
tara:strand:- start:104 stop:493 length:390 start_codon:yes stop_codon:yes gene_type:complete